MLNPGDKAPDFTGRDQNGNTVKPCASTPTIAAPLASSREASQVESAAELAILVI